MNNQSGSERLVYPDICKLIAIFLVTWGHCAQALSGLSFPPILGVPGLLIPIHMPLFMLMSGFFINPQKIQKLAFKDFITPKITRLLVPSLVWYLLVCLIALELPSFEGGGNYYWYLNALFICQILIFVTIKLFVNNLPLGCILSIFIVLFFPYSSYLKVNFMYPFLWAGYYARRFIESRKGSDFLLIVLIIVALLLYLIWDYKYSIYETPFDITHFTLYSLIVYLYRFSIGLTCSVVIILLTRRLIEKWDKLSSLSSYGQDTLFMYVSSFLINAIVSHFLNHLGLHITTVGVLDIVSIAYTMLIINGCTFSAKIIRKNAIARHLLLGE